jgi:hypothetical protein
MRYIWLSVASLIVLLQAFIASPVIRAQDSENTDQEYQKEKQSMLAMRTREPPRFMAILRSRIYNQLRNEDPEKYEEIMYHAYFMRKKQAEFMLKHGDDDKNGKLDDGEYKALRKKRDELLPLWFEACQADGGWSDISDIMDNVCEKAKPVTELKEAVYDELYLKERFNGADTDKDGVLAVGEIEKAKNDFGYFADKERFKEADLDDDAFLSVEECVKLKKEELEYFRERQKKAIEEIKKKLPDADLANVKWLKAHPEAVATLYMHPYWVKDNYETLQALRREGQWLEDNPSIGKLSEFIWKRFDLWDAEKKEVYESLVDFPLADKFFRNKDSAAATEAPPPRPKQPRDK